MQALLGIAQQPLRRPERCESSRKGGELKRAIGGEAFWSGVFSRVVDRWIASKNMRAILAKHDTAGLRIFQPINRVFPLRRDIHGYRIFQLISNSHVDDKYIRSIPHLAGRVGRRAACWFEAESTPTLRCVKPVRVGVGELTSVFCVPAPSLRPRDAAWLRCGLAALGGTGTGGQLRRAVEIPGVAEGRGQGG